MYSDFDIEKFTKEMQYGEILGLDYIKETIIDNLEEDKNKMTKTDYLKSLYKAVLCLNSCVVATEQCVDISNKNCKMFDRYAELRDFLFEELGIKYNYDYNYYYFEREVK